MTRAAHRILERARANVWRRVGIPATWHTPAPDAPKADEATGQNVAGQPAEEAGTGRPAGAPPDANDDKPDR
jgi:hypothetical protein